MTRRTEAAALPGEDTPALVSITLVLLGVTLATILAAGAPW